MCRHQLTIRSWRMYPKLGIVDESANEPVLLTHPSARRDSNSRYLNPMRLLQLRRFYKLVNLRAVLGIGVEVEGPSGPLL
jgi:hypothetical protein